MMWPGASPQKFEQRGQAARSEAYEGASARSGRAGTIGLMLKFCETWGRRTPFGESGGGQLPQASPVATPLHLWRKNRSIFATDHRNYYFTVIETIGVPKRSNPL